MRFLKSKNVGHLEDTRDEKCYYVRGQVLASFKLEVHEVHVAISSRVRAVQTPEELRDVHNPS